MLKKIPNFDKIHIKKIIEYKGIFLLPRFSNDGITPKYEAFIKKGNAGKGSFGTGYRSLGVLQTDENGNETLKKCTQNGGFQRFIKEYLSAEEAFKKSYPELNFNDYKDQFIKEYETDLCQWAANIYHNGNLAAKELIKDKETGRYYLVMHAIDGCEVKKYVEKNTIEPFNKLVIARNIARACKIKGDNNIIHNDYKPDNLLIDPDTLSIKIIDFDHSKKVEENGCAENNLHNLRYTADEKLNSSFGSLVVTKATDVYAIVASIIDIIGGDMNTSLNNFNKAFDKQLENKIKSSPYFSILKNKNDEVEKLKASAMWEYYGKNMELASLGFSDFICNGIKMCAASNDRIKVLTEEIILSTYDLSPESKNKLINVCVRGLAIDPTKRPTQEELVNTLDDIVMEFRSNFLLKAMQPIVDKLANFERKFPNIMQYQEITALCRMMAKFSKQEKITQKEINLFHKYAETTLSYVANKAENEEKFKIYLDNINKEIIGLENYVKKSHLSDDIQYDVIQLKEKIISFIDKPIQEKIKYFNEFKDNNVILLNKLKEKINKEVSILRSGLHKLMRHSSVFKSPVTIVYDAMKDQSVFTNADYLSKPN